MKASEIATLVDGVLEGGGDPDISGVAPLDRAGPTDLSLLADPRYLGYVGRSQAGAVLVSQALAPQAVTSLPTIRVTDAHRALAAVLPHLYPPVATVPGVHPAAVIGPGADIGDECWIDAFAVIGAGARIGRRARIGAHTVVGANCEVGEDVVLHPHVVLYPGTQVGARSILHSGARAGVDGFGYVPGAGGLRKIPQVGGCVIGADVEIGANTTIDRGSIGPTEIGNGAKIDNLVHVGHNVRIGDNAVIIAQVGIAGSARIGRGVTLGGQAGINGHIVIGDGVTVAGQAGVFNDVPAGQTISGYPARPHKVALRAQAALFRMPELMKRLRAVERAVFGKAAADE